MLDINNIFITLLDYPISYLELIGTLSGLICVVLAARNNIHTWTLGIINVIFFFILFYQVRLYSDMILQIYFMYANIIGILYWNKATKKDNKITLLTINERIKYLYIIISTWILLGLLMNNIHNVLPSIFPEPASYPYWDSFTTVTSIIACWLLAKKKIESWLLWIVIDIICIVLYYQKGIMLMSIEYFIFLINAIYGLLLWVKLRQKQ